ncbi:MAG TPA: molybdopterin-dependent oxidoreductase, partial [Ktedonobacterales bacterium]
SCFRCVRFTQEIAMENGLVMLERGFRNEIGVDPQAPFDTIFSGNVVELCPVGALTAKSFRFVTRPWELRRTASVCGQCAVGCNVRVDVRVDKVLRQYGRTNDAIDDGWLCDRGRWQLDLINSPERLRTPLIRRDGQLQPASWEEAITLVATRLTEIAQRAGAQRVGGIGSTHTTNEEAYLFQKLLRAGLGTNNVDHYHGRFPVPRRDGVPWVWTDSIAGLERASHIVLLGADPYTRQPIVDLRIRKAIRRGAKVYVLTPRANRLDRLATETLRYTAGQTGNIARALLGILLEEQLTRGDYATRHAKEIAARARELAKTSPDQAARAAGVEAGALRELARELAQAQGAVLLYDEMATREPTGATLAADVLDFALFSDNAGRAGAGAGPLFEDNNSLGARDMGVLPDLLPGYVPVADARGRQALAAAWGGQLLEVAGLDYETMLNGGVSALFVLGADPARHATPAQRAYLEKLEFLVAQDLFLTETAKLADVVLPAVAYSEKDGTFTNTERCVQVVRRAMTELPGARADWQILTSLAKAMGLGWSYLAPNDVLREIARVVPLYAGASRKALGLQGARWPLAISDANGAGPALRGTPHLTWAMLEQGIGTGMDAGGGASATPRGRGEQG